MRRREFIALIGGAAASRPFAAGAQQPAMPVIGFLRSASLTDVAYLVTAFRQGLKEADFVEGQNVAIEYRSAEERPRHRACVCSGHTTRGRRAARKRRRIHELPPGTADRDGRPTRDPRDV